MLGNCFGNWFTSWILSNLTNLYPAFLCLNYLKFEHYGWYVILLEDIFSPIDNHMLEVKRGKCDN